MHGIFHPHQAFLFVQKLVLSTESPSVSCLWQSPFLRTGARENQEDPKLATPASIADM